MTDEEDAAGVVALTLPDGTTLLLPMQGMSLGARDELETWSLIADEDVHQVDENRRGDPATWVDVLSAGSLLVAAIHGVVGNAAWSVFPAAARYLASFRERPKPLDAGIAAEHARDGAARALGVSPKSLVVESSQAVPNGTWSVVVIHGAARLDVELDASGRALRVAPRART